MRRYLANLMIIGLMGCTANSALSVEDETSVADALTISSGLEGGGYWNTGNRLQVAASGMGLTVTNQASSGSLTNLKNLLGQDDSVSLAFAQEDALQYYLKDNPGAEQDIEVLEDIGLECVFIISDAKGDLRTDKDIQNASRMHLGIKSPNSGIRVTFDYMASLVPELRSTTVRYGNAVEMMEGFVHPKTNVERAVMVVHGPNERSPEIDMVIANPDQYRFVKVTDDRFTQPSADGDSVYQSMRVVPGAVAGASAVQTICVRGLLLANKTKLTIEQHEKVQALIDTQWEQIHLQEQ